MNPDQGEFRRNIDKLSRDLRIKHFFQRNKPKTPQNTTNENPNKPSINAYNNIDNLKQFKTDQNKWKPPSGPPNF